MSEFDPETSGSATQPVGAAGMTVSITRRRRMSDNAPGPQMGARMGGRGGQGRDATSAGPGGRHFAATNILRAAAAAGFSRRADEASRREESTILVVFYSRPGDDKIVFIRRFCPKTGVI